MARTYPYSLSYDTCLGPTEDPYNFSSVYIEELYSGQRTYVKHVQQIVDLLPRTLDPSSRYTLRAHVTPSGHQRMRDSQDGAVVVPASRRRLQACCSRITLLPRTPGTACGLARG